MLQRPPDDPEEPAMTFLGRLAENAAVLLVVLVGVGAISKFVSAFISSTSVREFVRFPCDLMVFLVRVHRDGRMPTLSSGLLLGAGLYWISPIDVMPALIPGPAMLDDFVVAVVALRFAVRAIPPSEREYRCPADSTLMERYLDIDGRPR
jgi:uncharacterized membrane protein YkvA (DUF1232 family)